MKACVIIAAAGRSTRFGDQDKLSQDLGGRALLLRTVEVFTKREEVGSIIVAGPPENFDEFREKFGPTLGFHGARLVKGGTVERWESVRKALVEVPDDCTHVAIHDAARPGVSNDLLGRLFHAAVSLNAVVPAVSLTGTIKRVADVAADVGAHEDDAIADSILGDAGRVEIPARPVVETIDRSNLVEVQTPQIFEINLLKRAYAQDDLAGVTDDAMVVERLGEPVHIIEGERTNIKVTTQGDLALMRAILGVKPPAERPAHKRF